MQARPVQPSCFSLSIPRNKFIWRSPHSSPRTRRLIMSSTSTNSENPVAVPRPSASLIVVNERNEILLVHRNPKARSFGGMTVSCRCAFSFTFPVCDGSCLSHPRSFLAETMTRSRTHLWQSPQSEKLLKKQDFYLFLLTSPPQRHPSTTLNWKTRVIASTSRSYYGRSSLILAV